MTYVYVFDNVIGKYVISIPTSTKRATLILI